MKSASVHTPAATTPGPWMAKASVHGSDFGIVAQDPSAESGWLVLAEVFSELRRQGDRALEEAAANARLIAAAPQLLEALKEVTELLDWACGIDLLPPDADGPAAKARAAIAAAQGQTP
jgi:hypothetical protein